MRRQHLHFHLGHDDGGHRHVRRRGAAEVRRAVERKRLQPEVVIVACGFGQVRWRNGMQRRRFMALSEQVRGDRCCFLMTLRRPPLIRPVRPF